MILTTGLIKSYLNATPSLVNWVTETEKFGFLYDNAPFILGIPAGLVNIIVVTILITSFCTNRESMKPNLGFLLNLSLADLVHVIILAVAVSIYDGVYRNEQVLADLDNVGRESLTVCKKLVGIWSFVYVQSAMAVLLLTIGMSQSLSNYTALLRGPNW